MASHALPDAVFSLFGSFFLAFFLKGFRLSPSAFFFFLFQHYQAEPSSNFSCIG